MATMKRQFKVTAKGRIVTRGVVYDRGDRFTVDEDFLREIADLVIVDGETASIPVVDAPKTPTKDRMVNAGQNRMVGGAR
jgi:hypothetical protein